ncbi:MAG: polysaccharide biosynthesis protein [Bacteroides sp.]|uniref:polysaccharide biosynthesis protein n=1 Tax=Bacteroides sp. TaxID=29523 RepID=UPI0026DF4334|nr:polysaccharide biosynthesis protein [Bacteroides sp.]MDO5420770.1 polysaccharide biosynthesis protein [Bacteroides sp.]
MNLKKYYKYFSSHIASKWTVLFVDIIIVVISMFFAYVLQYGLLSIIYRKSLYICMMLFALLCNVSFFCVFRTYVGVIRFSSFVDIYRVFLSLTSAYGILSLGNFCWSVLDLGETLPNSILFMAYVLTFFFMVCVRIAVKILYETIAFDVRHCTNVFIYGFRGTGVNVAKSLRVAHSNHYRLRGFISDEPDMIGRYTMGCRIYPNDERLYECMKKKNVNTIIVSPGKIVELEKSGMLGKLLSHNIYVMTVPPLSDCINDGGMNIQTGNWFRRESIQIDTRKIAVHVEGHRVMVIGAAGAVGRGIIRHLAALNPYQLILVDQAESPLYDVQLELSDHWKNLDVRVLVADVVNYTRMEAVFREARPQLVFHTAAYKNAQLMDDYVSEAIQTNVLGTMNIADLALEYGVERMVMVSIDKADLPSNSMEYTKCLAEIYIQSCACKLQVENNVNLLVVRFGDVYPKKAHSLMTLSEACALILEVGVMEDGGRIYLLEGGGDNNLEPTACGKVKCEVSPVYDYAQVRKLLSTLVKQSYAEKTKTLIGEIRKVISQITENFSVPNKVKT